ncbi:rhamnolipids biosynthesis 3-oxoacyl [Ophiostoma piceae UAMH 11346]|uniref:Rhamnolipids biosynthesis 3-oxoacyl n=1 Tax=Ophiostoma piceae (strain UAMH 11346) TaxID=1262450 RepID=S3BUJ2_OPHP1|nr:rhamnolipids biosynthesis 3-oxoacyl [Ophiostoma piceae UAMH 11346]
MSHLNRKSVQPLSASCISHYKYQLALPILYCSGSRLPHLRTLHLYFTMTSATPKNEPFQVADLFATKGLVALITGGGTGIGLIMAQTLAAAGAAKIYVVGRRFNKVQEAAASVNSTLPAPIVIPLECDVASKDDLAKVAAYIEADAGFLNVVLVNAGVSGPQTPTPADDDASATLEDWRKQQLAVDPEAYQDTFKVNTTGVWFTTVTMLSLLDAGNKRGNVDQTSQVIVTTSIAGFNRKAPGGWAYGQSKSAATHAVKQLATLLPRWDIRVNALCPGLFPSEMSANYLASLGATAGQSTIPIDKKTVPIGRIGDEKDMGGTVLYMVSRAGAYLNGNVIVVDGGRLVMSLPKNTIQYDSGPRDAQGRSEDFIKIETLIGQSPGVNLSVTIEEQRAILEATCAQRDKTAITKELAEGVTAKDLTVTADDGYEIHIRVYSTVKANSASDGKLRPAALYMHGGGWMIGSVQADDLFARTLALELDHIVVSVDYRLAPEYTYPVAGNDCYSVLLWLLANAGSLNVDTNKVYVTGNSAGAHLSAVVALKVVQSDNPTALAAQVLRIPCTCHPEAIPGPPPPKRANVPIFNDGAYLTMFNTYAKVEHAKNPDVSPLLADPELLKKLPPTYIDVCTEDPLYDGGVAYAKKLEDLGVPVKLFVLLGMPHGSFVLFQDLPSSIAINKALLEGVEWALSVRK